MKPTKVLLLAVASVALLFLPRRSSEKSEYTPPNNRTELPKDPNTKND